MDVSFSFESSSAYNAGYKIWLASYDKNNVLINIKTSEAKTILAIGNSFSVDAMQWLYNIAENCGVQEVVLGNFYIGSCGLSTHWNCANNNNPSYIYYKNNLNRKTYNMLIFKRNTFF